MSPLTHILIADEDILFINKLTEQLTQERGFCVDAAITSGNGMMELLHEKHPDIVVIDFTLPGVSSLALLRDIQLLPADIKPCVFVVSSFASEQTITECERLGAAFFLRKPIDIPSILELFVRYGTSSCASNLPKQPDSFLKVSQLLNNLLLPPHLKGYVYVRDAIMLTLSNRSAAEQITKELYPTIAKKYGVSWNSVERDIRHVISTGWLRCGGSFPGFRSKTRPKNREFIITISEYIQFSMHIDPSYLA